MQTVTFLPNELWYGGLVIDADKYPLSAEDEYELNAGLNATCNQLNPVFLSNKGRYIWLENGGMVRFNKGVIEIEDDSVSVERAGKTLKEAAKAAAEKYYPATGETPDERAFLAPQYCSWVVLLWSQNQASLLDYARSVVNKGFKPGIFIVDDTWQQDYGVWEFHKSRFPDAKEMVKELRALGFTVVLWTCPYVSPDAPQLSPGIFEHMQAGRVLTDESGKRPRIISWWNGYSAMLDFRKAETVTWFNEKMQYLADEYGVEGFKLDGGDAVYTGLDFKDGTRSSALYIDGVKQPLKEARSCYKLAGKPIIQRLNDKLHLWKNDGYRMGLEALLPGIMTQGLIGYYYCCPDMVGGGSSADFANPLKLDNELVIRWCQASALMPMVQFSYDVWNHEEEHVAAYCKKAMELRESLLGYLVQTIKNAAKNNEPVVRYMEYEYPTVEFAGVKDQFMLGSDYLVAPVLEKGKTEREVLFPEGKWTDIADGTVYTGGRKLVPAPLDKLPVFKKTL